MIHDQPWIPILGHKSDGSSMFLRTTKSRVKNIGLSPYELPKHQWPPFWYIDFSLECQRKSCLHYRPHFCRRHHRIALQVLGVRHCWLKRSGIYSVFVNCCFLYKSVQQKMGFPARKWQLSLYLYQTLTDNLFEEYSRCPLKHRIWYLYSGKKRIKSILLYLWQHLFLKENPRWAFHFACVNVSMKFFLVYDLWFLICDKPASLSFVLEDVS